MVSSKNNSADFQWATKMGATDYITKPYESNEVLEKIQAV